MTAARTGLLLVLVFTLVQLVISLHGARAGAQAPVLVPCADGPTCAVPASDGLVRTVNVTWVHVPLGVTE